MSIGFLKNIKKIYNSYDKLATQRVGHGLGALGDPICSM
jgi:hypothetical protein